LRKITGFSVEARLIVFCCSLLLLSSIALKERKKQKARSKLDEQNTQKKFFAGLNTLANSQKLISYPLLRIASTGSMPEACKAGITPAKIPIKVDQITPESTFPLER